MPFQINPYAGLLVVSALLSAALAVAAWRRRPTPGAGTLAALMLALAFWSAFDAIELLSTSLTANFSGRDWSIRLFLPPPPCG